MVSQYPYKLFRFVSVEAQQNEYGDLIPGASGWVFHSMCRDEANTQGKQVIKEDGQAHVYDALIQMPKTALDIAAGTPVQVRNVDGTTRVSGELKRFRKDQMHCRAWL